MMGWGQAFRPRGQEAEEFPPEAPVIDVEELVRAVKVYRPEPGDVLVFECDPVVASGPEQLELVKEALRSCFDELDVEVLVVSALKLGAVVRGTADAVAGG